MNPAIDPRDENSSPSACAHVAANFLDEIDRAGDIRLDDALRLFKILVEKAFAESASRVRQQSLNRFIVSLRGADKLGRLRFGWPDQLPRPPRSRRTCAIPQRRD